MKFDGSTGMRPSAEARRYIYAVLATAFATDGATMTDHANIDYSERAGFLVGRSAALAEWRFRQEQKDVEFKRLVWRLQAKKYWATKDPARKAAIRAYRDAWRRANPERHNASSREAKRRRRANPEIREAEYADKRAKRARERQLRRAATVYTCVVCGTEWSPAVGRIPARAPKYCMNGTSCRARANYLRAKARGAAWVMKRLKGASNEAAA